MIELHNEHMTKGRITAGGGPGAGGWAGDTGPAYKTILEATGTPKIRDAELTRDFFQDRTGSVAPEGKMAAETREDRQNRIMEKFSKHYIQTNKGWPEKKLYQKVISHIELEKDDPAFAKEIKEEFGHYRYFLYELKKHKIVEGDFDTGKLIHHFKTPVKRSKKTQKGEGEESKESADNAPTRKIGKVGDNEKMKTTNPEWEEGEREEEERKREEKEPAEPMPDQLEKIGDFGRDFEQHLKQMDPEGKGIKLEDLLRNDKEFRKFFIKNQDYCKMMIDAHNQAAEAGNGRRVTIFDEDRDD